MLSGFVNVNVLFTVRVSVIVGGGKHCFVMVNVVDGNTIRIIRTKVCCVTL